MHESGSILQWYLTTCKSLRESNGLSFFYWQLHSNSDKGDGSVRYLLSGEGAGTIFIIDEVTGDIQAAKSLDREKKAHYVLHAQAIDRHTNKALEPESEFIIKVQDVNDNAPKFPEGPFVATVPEMSNIGKAGPVISLMSLRVQPLAVGLVFCFLKACVH